MDGSLAFSSAVKWPRTKSMSPSFWRSSGFPVPSRSRGKSVVLRWEVMDLRPLLPPLEPLRR